MDSTVATSTSFAVRMKIPASTGTGRRTTRRRGAAPASRLRGAGCARAAPINEPASPVRSLARPEILTLKPYSHAAWLPALTRLHANEAPWRPTATLRRSRASTGIPSPQPQALVNSLAAPALTASLRRCCWPPAAATRPSTCCPAFYLRAGMDAIMQCTPTFGMYQVAARLQGAEVLEVPLDRARGWELDVAAVLAAWQPRVKLVYLCSPNNPTANALDARALEAVCTALAGKAMVVIGPSRRRDFRSRAA